MLLLVESIPMISPRERSARPRLFKHVEPFGRQLDFNRANWDNISMITQSPAKPRQSKDVKKALGYKVPAAQVQSVRQNAC